MGKDTQIDQSGKRQSSKLVKEQLLKYVQDFEPGTELPPRERIAEIFSTTRSIIDRLLRELSAEGLISGGSGRRRQALPPSPQGIRSVIVLHDIPSIESANRDTHFGKMVTCMREICAERSITFSDLSTSQLPSAAILAKRGIQGLIALRPGSESIPTLLELHQKHGIHVVSVAGPSDVDNLPSVSTGNAHGTHLAVRAFVKAQRPEIAYVTLNAAHPDHLARTQAFFDAASASGVIIEPGRIHLRQVTPWATQDIMLPLHRQQIRKWLESLQERADQKAPKRVAFPRAILAADSLTGKAVWAALREDMDKKIPGDVQLIHFDESPEASLLGISVIAQDVSGLARQAVDLLVSLASGEKADIHRTVKVVATARQSAPDLTEEDEQALSISDLEAP